MKLVVLALVLLLGGTAHADRSPHKKQQLRQLLLQHFDKNGDGKLQPRERKHAKRVLRRLAKGARGKHMRRQRLIQRYDRDGDGNLGPGELPPTFADELRPLDRDGDGWLRGNELP